LGVLGVYSQATVTGHISAEVVEAITVGESSPMNFGRISASELSGAMVIPSNGKTKTGALSNINPAVFSISGSEDATFAVTLPEGPTTVTNMADGSTMKVTDWTSSSDEGSESYLLAGGVENVKVGATLQVGSTTENLRGTFTGSYKVTFAYN